jgi:hypothetical protein
VPKLPFLGFAHVAEEHAYNSRASVNWSLACWHDLATYLNLLDPSQPIAAGCKERGGGRRINACATRHRNSRSRRRQGGCDLRTSGRCQHYQHYDQDRWRRLS